MWIDGTRYSSTTAAMAEIGAISNGREMRKFHIALDEAGRRGTALFRGRLVTLAPPPRELRPNPTGALLRNHVTQGIGGTWDD